MPLYSSLFTVRQKYDKANFFVRSQWELRKAVTPKSSARSIYLFVFIDIKIFVVKIRYSNVSRSFRRRYGDLARGGVSGPVPPARPPSSPAAFIPGVHVRRRAPTSPSRGSRLVAEAGAAGLPRLMRLVWLPSGLINLIKTVFFV